jgi:hypothetical protein
MFEGVVRDTPEEQCVAIIQSLPLVYSSLAEHQEKYAFCNEIRSQIQNGKGDVSNYQLHAGLLRYRPKGACTRTWLVPEALKAMVLHYFHDCAVRAFRCFQDIQENSSYLLLA